jgi:hypothetical protein
MSQVLDDRQSADRFRQIENAHRVASGWLLPWRAGERRCMARTPTKVAAALRPRGHGRYPVTVADVSPAGCRIAQAGFLGAGSYAWITFPSIEGWYARVAWCQGDVAGLDFTQPLHPAVTQLILERSESL